MIKVGNTVQMELDHQMGDEHQCFRTKVLDYEKGFIYIDYPVDESTGKPVYFLQGTQFKVWFVGKDEAVYLFETEVLGKIDQSMPMLILKDPGEERYLRVQRREYVRIETAVDTVVYPADDSFFPFSTVSLDISGGGLALVLPENHAVKRGQALYISLSLPFRAGDIHYIHTKAELIRVIDRLGPLKGSFKFVDISDKERQAIVRYCFERQLEAKKKESLKS